MTMQTRVTWTGHSGSHSKMGFLAETGSGHSVMMDGAVDESKPLLSGANSAPRPMELLLAGLGGCSSYDVVLILRRGRHSVQGCTVQIDAERAESTPRVFTKIHLQFTVTGQGIPLPAVERAVTMSHEKYCSAGIMLGKTADITVGFTYTDTREEKAAGSVA